MNAIGHHAKELRRLWPESQPTRRLMVITTVTIVSLLAFGITALIQITGNFSSIDVYVNNVIKARAIASTLYEVKALQLGMMREVMPVTDSDPPPAPEVLQQLTKSRQQMDWLLDQLEKYSTADDEVSRLELSARIAANMDELQALANARLVRTNPDNPYQLTVHGKTISFHQVRDHVQASEQVMDDWHRHVIKRRNDFEGRIYIQQFRMRAVTYLVFALGGIVALVLGVLLVSYMHKRDEVEHRLIRTLELWQGSLNAIKKGIALFSSDQRLILWNPGFASLHGVEPGQMRAGMLATDVVDLSATLGSPVQREHLRDIYSGKNSEVADVDGAGEFTRQDGVRIQVSLYHMDSEHYVVTISDVTDIRHAEQLAREQAIRLGTIMNSVPDAIVTTNASGAIESWNAAAEQMFGYAASDIIRRNVSVLVHDAKLDQHAEPISQYLQDCDRSIFNRLYELNARRQDGTEFPIDLRISEMRLGSRRMFVGVIRDITERRAVERMKNEFIAAVSHELRTPLTSMMGACALLISGAAGPLSDKAQRLVAMAEKNGKRLSTLINDILDLEKAEAGRLMVNLAPLPLEPILRHAIDANRSYAMQFDVELQFDATQVPVQVMVDEQRMMQIMANLISNAVKHSPPHSIVLITMTVHADHVRVAVHDSGQGVPETFRQRVFQRFAQADGSGTRHVAGTGLGLVITKQLVELHAGTIGFESGASLAGASTGATFWFELPTVKESQVMRPSSGADGHASLQTDDHPAGHDAGNLTVTS